MIGVEEANRKAAEEMEGKKMSTVNLGRPMPPPPPALGEPFRLDDSRRTGLSLEDQDDEDYGLTLTSARSRSRSRSALAGVTGLVVEDKEEESEQDDLWWHPWEIKSECGEMGTMDCFGEGGGKSPVVVRKLTIGIPLHQTASTWDSSSSEGNTTWRPNAYR